MTTASLPSRLRAIPDAMADCLAAEAREALREPLALFTQRPGRTSRRGRWRRHRRVQQIAKPLRPGVLPFP
eukprot:5932277-Alexandrium_andersonii.AAC.1